VSRPHPVELRLDDAALSADRTALLARVTERVRATCALVVLADVGDLTADCAALDALARVHLTARRAGADLVIEHASADLLALLDLAGLAGVLRTAAGSSAPSAVFSPAPSPLPSPLPAPVPRSVEVVGQPELGEEGRVDEVRDAGDPPVAHLEHVDRPGLAPPGDRAGLVLREGG
jgi:hypothetical protein